jgi:hypothetical protein
MDLDSQVSDAGAVQARRSAENQLRAVRLAGPAVDSELLGPAPVGIWSNRNRLGFRCFGCGALERRVFLIRSRNWSNSFNSLMRLAAISVMKTTRR